MATIILATLYLITTTHSVPCIPANTCFAQGNHEGNVYDSSYMMTCEAGGTAKKTVYLGSVNCDTTVGSHSTNIVTDINTGDKNINSGSGSITTDYLQGTNCAINQPSETCSDYMLLKHRGTGSFQENGAPQPYKDIGDNCGNYIGSETTFTQYTSVAIPIACVSPTWTGGSIKYYCDAQKWGFIYYAGPNCQGTEYTAQSDEFTVDTCDFFSETTHCQSGQTTGCTDGVLVEFWSWYDLECCPVDGKRCYGTAKGAHVALATPTQTPTPRPTGPGIYGTSSPTTKPVTQSGVNGKCIFYGFLMVIGVIWNM